MKNKQIFNMVISALLLAMGLVFHTIVPGIFFGMKPDFILVFMFIAYLIKPSFTNALIIGIAGGFLSGLTTGFPGGFLPNLIDKPITMISVFLIVFLLEKLINSITSISDRKLLIAPIIGVIGTLVSGSVFLYSALLIVGLPGGASFGAFFYSIVLPTTIINGIATTFIYVVMNAAGRRANSRYYRESNELSHIKENTL